MLFKLCSRLAQLIPPRHCICNGRLFSCSCCGNFLAHHAFVTTHRPCWAGPLDAATRSWRGFWSLRERWSKPGTGRIEPRFIEPVRGATPKSLRWAFFLVLLVYPWRTYTAVWMRLIPPSPTAVQLLVDFSFLFFGCPSCMFFIIIYCSSNTCILLNTSIYFKVCINMLLNIPNPNPIIYPNVYQVCCW